MKIVGLVSPEPCPLVRLISCDLFAPGSLKSGTPNFWKTEGAQKVTFSIQNLYSQMHFRSQMCPGGLFKGFEADLNYAPGREIHLFFKGKSNICTTIFTKWMFFFQGRSKIWTIILRKSLIFQREIKDFNDKVEKCIGFYCKIKYFKDHVKKITVFSKGDQRFQPDC